MNEYSDNDYITNFCKEKSHATNNIIDNNDNNDTIYNISGKNMEFNEFTIIKDVIRNYRKLSSSQLENIQKLSENKKIEIIQLYNNMMSNIETIIFNV